MCDVAYTRFDRVHTYTDTDTHTHKCIHKLYAHRFTYIYACRVDSHTPTVTKQRTLDRGPSMTFICSFSSAGTREWGPGQMLLLHAGQMIPSVYLPGFFATGNVFTPWGCMCFWRALLSDQSTPGEMNSGTNNCHPLGSNSLSLGCPGQCFLTWSCSCGGDMVPEEQETHKPSRMGPETGAQKHRLAVKVCSLHPAAPSGLLWGRGKGSRLGGLDLLLEQAVEQD